MAETEKTKNTQQFVQEMQDHQQQMEDVRGKKIFTGITPYLDRLHLALKTNLGLSGDFSVITGEQPYGPLGKPKVLGKRILATALKEQSDITTIELFADNDLVGSEEGFYKLVVPSAVIPEGTASINLLSEKHRRNGTIASGILLPNQYLNQQVEKIYNSFGTHYPGRISLTKDFRFDPKVLEPWTKLYGVTYSDTERKISVSEISKAENYAEAHTKWLVDLEKRLGIKMDKVVSEAEIDLILAQNGGIELMQQLWVRGLQTLEKNNHQPITLKLTPEEYKKTPFNLAFNGSRLKTSFANEDHSLVKAELGKHEQILTMDEVVSGNYKFSWRAVPRVIIYSLSGLDGHITGGGSVYNADAKSLLQNLDLPYFPIINMDPRIDGQKVGLMQYKSLAASRRNSEQMEDKVRSGKVSLLDLLLSCDEEVIKEAIAKSIKEKNPYKVTNIISVPNKEEETSL